MVLRGAYEKTKLSQLWGNINRKTKICEYCGTSFIDNDDIKFLVDEYGVKNAVITAECENKDPLIWRAE